MTTRKELIALKVNLPTYLRELSMLFGRPVVEDDLLSLDETRALQERSRQQKREPVWRVEVPFTERRSKRFNALVSSLRDLNPSPVHVWIDRVDVCGVPRAVRLKDLRFDFEFSALSSGIVTVSTADLADDMVLDFSRDEQGSEVLQIEVSGPRWTSASY